MHVSHFLSVTSIVFDVVDVVLILIYFHVQLAYDFDFTKFDTVKNILEIEQKIFRDK